MEAYQAVTTKAKLRFPKRCPPLRLTVSRSTALNVKSSEFSSADLIVLSGFFSSSLPPPTTFSSSALQQPFPHESLLMDRRELRLSRDEKRAARKGYEEEKRASVPYTRPSYAHYYPASDQSLTNIPAFSQRNWSVTHLNVLKHGRGEK